MYKRLISNGLFILAIAGILAACSSREAPTPEAAGFSSTGLADVQAYLEGYVDRGELAGFVGVIMRGEETAFYKTYGWQDIATETPMTANTIFRMASLTKPLTSIAVLQLYERGLLRLDDPVAELIPSFANLRVYVDENTTAPLARPITIQDLLMHTSGLSSTLFGQTPVERMYQTAGLVVDDDNLAALMDRLSTLPLAHQPGAQFTYGFSTDVLARVVEIVSNQSFDDFLQVNIFDPLGMSDTGFTLSPAQHRRLATLYTKREAGLVRVPARWEQPSKFPRGNSGLASTAEDYLRFAQMLRNQGTGNGVQILKPETMALMTRNQLSEALTPIRMGGLQFPAPSVGFGLGFGIFMPDPALVGTPGTYFWLGSTHTYLWVDPEKDIIGLFLSQYASRRPLPILHELHSMVYSALL